MTLTVECDLDKIEMNQRAKYLGERSFLLIVIVHACTHTHTHTHREGERGTDWFGLPGLNGQT